MIRFYLFLMALLFLGVAQSQSANFQESPVSINRGTYTMYGTLTLPTKKVKKMPIALFIAGSGPTDRNGNNSGGLKSDAYLLLCQALAEKGIATLRYDKMGAGESKPGQTKLDTWTFDHEVDDAKAWVQFLAKDKKFTKITILGHSLGALVGTLAIQKTGKTVDKFVALCGIGLRGNETLKEQLSAQPKFVTDFSTPILDSLSKGLKVKNVPPYLEVLFRASMQPYIISWFKYEPAEELAKLSIPTLVVQGTNDIQIKVADAQHLVSKSKLAKLVLIEKMNHLFRLVEGDRAANLATYNQPTLPISVELVEKVGAFVLEKK